MGIESICSHHILILLNLNHVLLKDLIWLKRRNNDNDIIIFLDMPVLTISPQAEATASPSQSFSAPILIPNNNKTSDDSSTSILPRLRGPQRCRRCLYHDLVVPRKNHKKCPYLLCKCLRCSTLETTRRHMNSGKVQTNSVSQSMFPENGRIFPDYRPINAMTATLIGMKKKHL